MNDILDSGHHSCVVHHYDQPPFAMVNRVGLSLITLLTFLKFSRSHAFRGESPKMIWDSNSYNMEEPIVGESEQAMGFCTNTIDMLDIF